MKDRRMIDWDEFGNINLLYDIEHIGTIFKLDGEDIFIERGESGDIYIPGQIIKKLKNAFFRFEERDNEIILTPIKLNVKLVD